MSTSQLQRRFNRSMGMGIAQYWREVRFNKAKQLLLAGYLSIEAISSKVGYENLSAFSRAFNHAIGQPPSQWRQMMLTAKKLRL